MKLISVTILRCGGNTKLVSELLCFELNRVYAFTPPCFTPPIEDAFLYMGYYKNKGDLKLIEKDFDRYYALALALIRPRALYMFVKPFMIDTKQGIIKFYVEEKYYEFKSFDLSKKLEGSIYIVLMASTIGFALEKKVKELEEKGNLLGALMLDAIGSASADWVLDELERYISSFISRNGFYLLKRYSPGYGDFGLENQVYFIEILNALSRINLNCTENFILLPRKSVTALNGIKQVR